MIKKYSILFCILVSGHAFGMDKKPSGYNPLQNLAHNIRVYEKVLKRRFDPNRPVTFLRPVAETAIDALPLIGYSLVYDKLTDKVVNTLPLDAETKQVIASSLNNALKANLGYAIIDNLRPSFYGNKSSNSAHHLKRSEDRWAAGDIHHDENGVPLTSPIGKNLFGISVNIGTDLCVHAAKQTAIGKKIHDTIDKHFDIAPGSIAAIVQFIAIGLLRYKIFG